MSGKVAGALAAIAVSSASASVVGVIYTGVVSLRHDAPAVSGVVEASERAPKGFVVDATKDHVTSLPDVPAENGPRCQDVGGPGRCVVVLPLSEPNLNFFWFRVTLPWSDFYSSDEGDDVYRVRLEGRFIELFVDPRQGSKVAAQDSSQDDSNGQDNTSEAGSQTADYSDFSAEQTSTPSLYSIVVGESYVNDFTPYTNTNFGDSSTGVGGWSTPSGSSGPIGSIPEPSTWAMLLAGFAGLGFLGWRRARASQPPQRRRAT